MFCITHLHKMVIVIIVWGFLGIGTMFGSNNRETFSQDLGYTIGYAKFAKGSCTEYAASRRKDLFPSRNGKDRLFGGDAISWLGQAKRKGIPTSKQPSVGDIAVFGQGRGAGSSYGHVAIVEKIIDDHTIVVSDMNFVSHNTISQRSISSKLALGYIHTRSPARDKKPTTHKIQTGFTVTIQLTTKQPSTQTMIGSSLGGTIESSIAISSETILYATPTNSSLPENDTEQTTNISVTIADTRYIMQHIAERKTSIDIV